jgi:3-oxoacyl-[acyl-carrier protein] reductase
VSSVPDIERLYDAAAEEFGRIDIVVANAGMEKVNIPFTDVTEEDFDLLWRVNTKGPYFVLREAARRIADHGRIITISSNTTTVPQVGVALYGTSKIAMSYLVRVAALELGARGVTVNTVVPGPIDNAGIFTDPSNDEYKQSLIDMIPIGRLGTPQDVAAITAFLASDDAGLITGQQIVADGGMH